MRWFGVRSLSMLGGLLVLMGVAGCGGGGEHEEVVIRIGGTPITNAAIAHWMSVMSPQHVLPVPPRFTACKSRLGEVRPETSDAELDKECARRYLAVRARAFAFLISSRWRIDEARNEGLGVSSTEVTEALRRKEASFSGGRDEFEESLKAIDRSLADVRFELEGELAAAAIRRHVLESVPAVTESDIAGYYRRNIAKYHIPELRHFDIGENIESLAVATRKKREAEAGKPFTSLHEVFPRRPYSVYVGEKRRIIEAIFKARPHVITEPVELNGLYFLVNVTKIERAYVKSLGSVHEAIEKKLNSERRRAALGSFVSAWRRKWTARTDCKPGWVVQKCRQYTGAKTPEEPLALE
jgi:foldase protein PrsA